MTFREVLASVAGLRHYYPLAHDARDVVGTAHGVVRGTGVSFTGQHARFTGAGYVELGRHEDFSVATTGGLTILVLNTIDSWRGAGASEYVHWMGKGAPGAHEYAFRHYVEDGTGEAPSRPKRTSFYHFNPSGGLGAGAYFQDDDPVGVERVITVTCDRSSLAIHKDGVRRHARLLSDYRVQPEDTGTPVCLGARGDGSGSLVGRLRRVAFYARVLTDAEVRKIHDGSALPLP